MESTTRYPVSLSAPSIHTLYKTRLRLENTLTVGVSQSGEGTDINLVLKSCKRQGSLVVGVTNNPGSEMAAIADEVFPVHAGKEHSVVAHDVSTSDGMHSDLFSPQSHAASPMDHFRCACCILQDVNRSQMKRLTRTKRA